MHAWRGAVWNVNHAYRDGPAHQKLTQKEVTAPDPRCLSYTHDRDFGAFKAYPHGTEHFEHSKAWCPPHEACYDSMERVFKQRRAKHAFKGEL